MKLIFTKSNSILSKGIRWLFNEPVSHMAILFDDKVVFHSNLLGTHINWLSTFKKHSEVVYQLDYHLTPDQEEEVFQECEKLDEHGYDWGAFFYLGLYGFYYKLTGKPLSNRNLWGSDNNFLCDELAIVLSKFADIPNNIDIMTPYKLYEVLNGQVKI